MHGDVVPRVWLRNLVSHNLFIGHFLRNEYRLTTFPHTSSLCFDCCLWTLTFLSHLVLYRCGRIKSTRTVAPCPVAVTSRDLSQSSTRSAPFPHLTSQHGVGCLFWALRHQHCYACRQSYIASQISAQIPTVSHSNRSASSQQSAYVGAPFHDPNERLQCTPLAHRSSYIRVDLHVSR